MNVPAHLPLDGGRITCVTCHQSSPEAHAQSRRRHDGMLRGPGLDPTFCAQCHQPKLGSRSGMHGGAIGRAHLRWPDEAKRPARRADRQPDETRTCMGCHDGSVARDVGVGPASRTGFGYYGRSHPVAVPYELRLVGGGAVARKMEMPVRPVGTLDGRIRLFAGKVGCGSCHSPYSRLDHLLVMPNSRSALCLACHQGA